MIPKLLRGPLEKVGAEITPVPGGEHLWVPGSDTEWDFGPSPRSDRAGVYHGRGPNGRLLADFPGGDRSLPLHYPESRVTSHRSRSSTHSPQNTHHHWQLQHFLETFDPANPQSLTLAVHYLGAGHQIHRVGPWDLHLSQTVAKSSRQPFDWIIRANAHVLHDHEDWTRRGRDSYIDHIPLLHGLAKGVLQGAPPEPFLDAYIDHFKLHHLPMQVPPPERYHRDLDKTLRPDPSL